MKPKRYNPLLMLFESGNLVRKSIVFAIYLFVIKYDSKSDFITYGRILFFLVIGLTFFSIVFKWFSNTYALDDRSFHLYKGIFNKSEQTIPFSKVQNINRHTSLFHQIFKVTSIYFETGMEGEDAAVAFKVISQKEADRIEALITSTVYDNVMIDYDCDERERSPQDNVEKIFPNRTIHFKPTKKDTIKASFTSLSFLILIPIYFKVDDLFHVGDEAKGIFEMNASSRWMIVAIVVFLILTSTILGIGKTFLKYGNYEMSSDHDRIYITKGVINKVIFSIAKERVQAIKIQQSLLKRLLGLAEVKLISAGSLSSEEDTEEVNSLYPFLPTQRAYELISEILPNYEVTKKMDRLPRKSLWVRMVIPSWLWIIATMILFYFKPVVWHIQSTWAILSAVLLILIIASRLLDFFHTRYILNDHFIQLKKGSLSTSLFVSKRDKVIEVEVTRNMIQKMLGLASIEIINRAQPVHRTGVNDISIQFANLFYKWYVGRKNEIKVE